MTEEVKIQSVERATPVPDMRGRLSRLTPWRNLARLVRARRDLDHPIETSDAGQPVRAPATATGRRPPLYLITFWLFVMLPSIANALYLAFIASDQYVATTRFAVRTASQEDFVDLPNSSGTQSPVGISTASVTGQDAYVVVAYIKSRTIIEDVSKTVDLYKIFRNPAADFWTRLGDDVKAEDLLDYWLKMVSASVDGPSGIVTVRVRAFAPEDSVTLASAIVAASEKLANDLSSRARGDLLAKAEEEVARAENRMKEALKAMQAYRDSVGYIDPVESATMTNKLLLELLGKKIELENEYFVIVRSASEDAPGVTPLKTAIKSIDEQIEKLKSTLTGDKAADQTISASLVRFEELELERTFAEKALLSAQGALDRARRRVLRQAIYVSVFVPPGLPEESAYPQRLSMSLIMPVALIVIWGIFALLVATIEDHTQ